jgi:murein DD-endopeptidase MepM/ murein hydrolase activator NlpD
MRQLLGAVFTLVFLAGCASSPAPTEVRTYTPPPGPPQVSAPSAAQGSFQPNAYLRSCGGIYVTNAPPMDGDFWVVDYKPIIVVGPIVMATAPANEVCLSSGFGIRSTRRHDGIDLQSIPAGPIYSAAPGRVLEARVSTGYGNMVLIDHGGGVYTRYAHLAHITDGIRPGVEVGFGQQIGMMGRSGNATAIHLHFEILTGNYNNPKGSKGLNPRNPFEFPAYEPGS